MKTIPSLSVAVVLAVLVFSISFFSGIGFEMFDKGETFQTSKTINYNNDISVSTSTNHPAEFTKLGILILDAPTDREPTITVHTRCESATNQYHPESVVWETEEFKTKQTEIGFEIYPMIWESMLSSHMQGMIQVNDRFPTCTSQFHISYSTPTQNQETTTTTDSFPQPQPKQSSVMFPLLFSFISFLIVFSILKFK